MPPRGRSRSVKWYKMAKVSVAYKHERYSKKKKKKKKVNTLRVVSNVKGFTTQDGRTNTTHYKDQYDTRVDQKLLHKCYPARFVLGLSVLVSVDRLVGLVVKVSASRAEDSGIESRLRRDFFRVESY